MKYLGLATLILGTWPVAGFAEVAPQGLPASVAACMSEREDARRLSCYDREIARLSAASPVRQAPAHGTPAQAAPAQAAAKPVMTPADPEAGFGFRGEVAREAVDQRRAETSTLAQLDSTITGIATRPHGELVLTLENAQVWAQKSPDSSFHLKAGDHVSIKRGSLGSFLMSGPTGRTTRVARVR